jgi:O-methyltransferase involved in polyketide biosynthesis
MNKNRIKLTREKETLLVLLYSKAVESRRSHPVIYDPKALEILASIDYDFRELRIPEQTLTTLAMRAKKLDSIAKAYIETNQNPLILHLGCGLDSRILRVGDETVKWYDLDYPDVIRLRKAFYEETPRYRMIPSSVTDFSWFFTDSQDIPSLGLWSRFMFAVAGRFKTARKAHRVLHFQL